MKLFEGVELRRDLLVAPYAGAWIEMTVIMGRLPPSLVAPYAGAWIEIRRDRKDHRGDKVAPYAGAWIEIYMSSR